jgi:hypothetical protein
VTDDRARALLRQLASALEDSGDTDEDAAAERAAGVRRS